MRVEQTTDAFVLDLRIRLDHQAYSSIRDLGGRGVPGMSAEFAAGLSGAWSECCRRSLSSLEVRLSAMGSAG
jgi:hypothetical protein